MTLNAGERTRLEANLRAAAELHETGVALMRQNLRRRHPGAGDEEIARLLDEWLHSGALTDGGEPGIAPSRRFGDVR